MRQLGQLGRRYDAGDLRRFAKPKRDALVACYLVEARKTLLDQIVEMNDLFLTGDEPPVAQRGRKSAQEPAPPRPRRAAPRAGRGRCVGGGRRRANRHRLPRCAGHAGPDRGGHCLPGLRAAGRARSSRCHARALRHAAPIPARILRPAIPGRRRQRDTTPGDRNPARPRCRHPRRADDG